MVVPDYDHFEIVFDKGRRTTLIQKDLQASELPTKEDFRSTGPGTTKEQWEHVRVCVWVELC